MAPSGKSHSNSSRCNNMASSGSGKDVLELIKKAEKMMYEDKADYYKRSGKERRGKASH